MEQLRALKNGLFYVICDLKSELVAVEIACIKRRVHYSFYFLLINKKIKNSFCMMGLSGLIWTSRSNISCLLDVSRNMMTRKLICSKLYVIFSLRLPIHLHMRVKIPKVYIQMCYN